MNLFRCQFPNCFVAVLLAGIATGWIAGGLPGKPGSAASPAAGSPSRTDRPPRPSREMPPSSVILRLAAVRAARTTEERQRATIHLARTLPVSEIETWYKHRWFPDDDHLDALLFERITRRRWLKEDPDGLLTHCLSRTDVNTGELLQEWVRLDPHQATAWMERQQSPRTIGYLAGFFVSELARRDPAAAIELIPCYHARLQRSYLTPATFDQLAAVADEALRQASATWPADLRISAERALAVKDLKADFAAGVEGLKSHPDGLRLFCAAAKDRDLADRVLEFLPELPPDWLGRLSPWSLVRVHPLDWIQADLAGFGLNPRLVAELRDCAGVELARTDPESALNLLAQGFRTDSMKYMLESSVRALAERDPERARALAARLGDPAEIALAMQTIEEATRPPEPPPIPPTPQEWIALDGASDDSWLHDGIFGVPGKWTPAEILDARDAFAALPESRKARAAARLAQTVGSGNLLELCGDGVAYLLAHPTADDDETAEGVSSTAGQLAAQWVTEDPLTACRWVESLPAGEARSWAKKNLVSRWSEYEPSAAAAWVRTLPSDQQEELAEFIVPPREAR